MEDVKACTGQSAELCVTATGTEPITYQWSKDGQIIHGATEACYVIDRVKASDVGEYTVEVGGKCGEPVTRSASLTLVDVRVALSSTYWCEGQTARICADVSGEGPFLYEWSRDGTVIAGATDECLILENVTEFDEGEYSVTVTGYCGVPTTAFAELYVGSCEQYCSLTQGFYGNPGGKWNGMSTLELLDMLIPPDDPLVVGVVGDRSIQFPDGSEHCIIEFLPGGATPAVLDPGLGDVMVNPSDCEFMGIETGVIRDPDVIAQGKLGTTLIDRRLLLDGEGRLRNNLLSQTLTLSLNVRLDPKLSDMPICREMIMIAALPGPDGLYGTADDVPDNDNPRFAEFPEAILRSLDDLGLPRTAGGILELANQALVGNLRRFGVTAGEVTGAVGSINDIADHCAMLIHCADPHGRIPGRISDVASKGPALSSEVEEVAPSSYAFRVLSRNPLPRGEGVQVSFAIPELSRVRVQVFDLRGRRVSEMPERMLNSGLHAIGINLQGRGRLPSGVYFLRMDAVGLLTGRQFANTQKVMLLP
jgi:hypothetical protein